MFGIVALVVSSAFWISWYSQLLNAFAPRTSPVTRVILAATPLSGLAIAIVVILRFATQNVSGDFGYSLAYIGLFSAVARLVVILMPLIGVQPLRDALECDNTATLPVTIAGILGTAALHAGANLGEGDDEYTTLFPLGASLVIWVAFAILLAVSTSSMQRLTQDRDWKAGCVFGGVWFTAAIPLARASAGDWVSFQATVIDLLGVLPELGLLWLAARYLPPHRSVSLGLACGLVTAASLTLPLASQW